MTGFPTVGVICAGLPGRALVGASAFLCILCVAACQDGTGLDGDRVTLEGTVEALFAEGVVAGAEITLDVLGAGGERAWAAATTDSSGAFAIEVTAPDGCVGDSVDAVLRATAPDHEPRVRGGPAERFRLACGAANALDVELYRNVFREPQPVAGDLVPTQLSVGRFHACAITAAGAYCWGASGYGRLGNASVTEAFAGSPVAVTNGETLVQISAGNEHTCALNGAGVAWCWGANLGGQVGADPSVVWVDEPFRVQTDLRFVQIQAGRWHSCGLTAEGTVHCWGDDRGVGAGGDPMDTIYSSPVPVVLDGTYVQVTSIFSSSCALRDTGDVYCWGFSYRGELGGGEDRGHHTTPVPVAGGYGWGAVDAGVTYGCGLTDTGAAYCWGTGYAGQLGYGGLESTDTPVAVAGDRSWASIRAGAEHTCALTGSGDAWCWGRSDVGQLGTPPDMDETCEYARCVTVPVEVPTDLQFTDLQAGDTFTCGITTAGELVCWGVREYLGSGRPLRAAAAADVARKEARR
jgi:alpha-tubulin suppressor-like RCC1 family protein